jgi:tetratricopeptide (TPR) repeat protein
MFPHDKLDWTLSRLEQRLEHAPDDTVARLEYATGHLSQAMFHDGGEMSFNHALTQARRVLQHDPSSPGALVVAGASLVGLGRIEAATRYLDEALKLQPDRADVHLALGTLHQQAGDRHQAVREMEFACRLAPGSWEPHYLLGRLLAERADELGGPRRMLERSQFHIVRALHLGPSAALGANLLNALGVMCLRTGRYNDALKLFTRLQDHDKYSDKAQYYLGLVSYHLGRYKNSILHHRRYLDKHGENAHVHARIGMSYLHLGEVQKAREASNHALAIEPGDLQARWTLGCAWLEEGHVDEAVRTFKGILQDAPDHLPAFTELVRIRRDRGDARWLEQALRAEVGGHDRVPLRDRRENQTGRGTIEIDPRSATRSRIRVVLEALAQLGEDTAPTILETMDLTTSEGLRYQLWEAALAQVASRRARKALRSLKEPGRHFGAQAGRDVLTLAEFLPEAMLTNGLQVEEDDLKRAAVERHGPATDVSAHRANVDRERQEARAWQSLLLLAVATRQTRSGRNLLVRWASDADPELADAARAALVMLGDTEAPSHLRERARQRGAEHLVDALLAEIAPTEPQQAPRPVSDDESAVCSTCGRRVPQVEHIMVGRNAAICNHCMMEIARNRRELATDNPSVACALSGSTLLESHAIYEFRGVPVAAEVVDESLGLAERDEVDRYFLSL